jgi:TolB protein
VKRSILIAAALGVAASLAAQTPAPPRESQELWLELNKTVAKKLPIALPQTIAPGGPAIEGQVRQPFYATLKADVEYEGAFSLVDATLYPAGYRDATSPESADRWLATGAEVLVDTMLEVTGDRVAAEARVYDLKSHKLVFGKRYSGGVTYVARIAHAVADDIVKYFTGKAGVFMTTIAFSSDRDGGRGLREIYAADYDGKNARRLTQLRSLAMNPSWERPASGSSSPATRRCFPTLNVMARDGSAPRRLDRRRVERLPFLLPRRQRIVFAGSQSRNPTSSWSTPTDRA